MPPVNMNTYPIQENNFCQKYSAPRALDASKVEDVMSLLCFIPEADHTFYKQLSKNNKKKSSAQEMEEFSEDTEE